MLNEQQHQLDVKVGRDGRRPPRRWSEAEKRRIVAESYAPGATVTGVAKRNDVGRDLVTKWRRHFGEAEPDVRPSAFVPVVVAPPGELISDDGGARPSNGRMEIVLDGCLRVVVDATVDAPALARVLAVLAPR